MARQRTQGGSPPHVPDPVKAEVRRLVEEYGLKGKARRTAACLDRLIGVFAAGVPADQLGGVLGRFPLSLLEDAIRSFGFERAARLVEREDLAGLARRIRAVEYLSDEDVPFFTLQELAAHLRGFAGFLHNHRDYIVQTGLPPRCFRPCRWLYLHLGRLYDTRTTLSPYPADELREGANVAPYEWASYAVDEMGRVEEIAVCRNDRDADLLRGMDPDDAERIERDRQRVFDVKLRVVELLADAAGRAGSAPTGVGDATLGVLKEAFTAEDIEFYFRMDRYYVGADALAGLDHGPDPKATPGGLTNLLEVAGHVQSELTHAALDTAKRAVPETLVEPLLEGGEGHRWRYFDIIDRKHRRAFDAAVDGLLARSEAVQTFWRGYRGRLAESLRREFRVLVTVEMMPQHAEVLRGIVQDYANEVQARRERGELVVVAQGKNIFRKDGDSWTIQFGGKLIGKPHADGLYYISQMLRLPNRPLSAPDLRALYGAWKADPRAPLRSDAADVVLAACRETGEDPDALRPQAGDLGEMIDGPTVASCQAELSRLQALRSEAAQRGDEAAAARHREQIEQIERYLGGARGLGGRRRSVKDAGKIANDAVRNAIERTLEDLAGAHPALHEHFRRFLAFGGRYCYSPGTAVEWEL